MKSPYFRMNKCLTTLQHKNKSATGSHPHISDAYNNVYAIYIEQFIEGSKIRLKMKIHSQVSKSCLYVFLFFYLMMRSAFCFIMGSFR